MRIVRSTAQKLRAQALEGGAPHLNKAETKQAEAVFDAKAAAKVLGDVPVGQNDEHHALLVLVRHGQSTWNLENRFTGWTDVPLTKEGERQAAEAADRLQGITFHKAYTSELSRAQDTLDIVLDGLDQKDIPVEKSQKLNERHYGSLQGQNKDKAVELYGKEQVHLWRRSYATRPPDGESLKDTLERAVPYFEQKVLEDVKAGKNVIVSAHGNSLRAIVKALEDLGDEEVVGLKIANGIPYVYEIDQDGKVLSRQILDGKDAEATQAA
jgi:2,3-bisphosphoglycerate-dependent phosphoglycerate mutase